jgi:hypothetical protein
MAVIPAYTNSAESDFDVNNEMDTDDGSVSATSSVLVEVRETDFVNYFVEHDGRLFSSSPLMVYPLPVDGHEQVVRRKTHIPVYILNFCVEIESST